MSGELLDGPNISDQAVGVEYVPPGDEPDPPPEVVPVQSAPVADAGFDPGAHTIDDVKAYVEAHPDERDAVTAAEETGKARSTLLDWLAG